MDDFLYSTRRDCHQRGRQSHCRIIPIQEILGGNGVDRLREPGLADGAVLPCIDPPYSRIVACVECCSGRYDCGDRGGDLRLALVSNGSFRAGSFRQGPTDSGSPRLAV